jgi:hypothetical protein
MNSAGWPLVQLAAQLLEPDEREAVLGDLAEEKESTWRGLLDIVGLFFRREAQLQNDPKPWLVGFGLALPCVYLLMIVSVSVSCTYQRLFNHRVFTGHFPTGHEGYFLFFCHIFLLIAWSWVGGYVVGSMSRRTLWWSAILSMLACAYCLATFCLDGVPRTCNLLFVLPAILGAYQGMRHLRITQNAAALLALTMAIVMIAAWTSSALWIFNWALLCPSWYLVATAHKPLAAAIHS